MSKDVPDIVLTLDYLPPSQNALKRMHWSAQYREKQAAYDALQCALYSTGFDCLIGTITPEARKICSMGYGTLRLYRATQKQTSTFKSSKSK